MNDIRTNIFVATNPHAEYIAFF